MNHKVKPKASPHFVSFGDLSRLAEALIEMTDSGSDGAGRLRDRRERMQTRVLAFVMGYFNPVVTIRSF